MVHADISVALLLKHFSGPGQHAQFLFRAGQGLFLDLALDLEPGREVGVVVQGNAIRPERQQLLQCPCQARFRLPGKPVNQICIDGAKTKVATPLHGVTDQLIGLNTIDRFLHTRIQVLHAQAYPVKAQPSQ